MLAVESVANIALSLALVKPLGIEGVAWGTTIPNLIVNVFAIIYVCRVLKVGLGGYIRESFLVPLAFAPIPVTVWLAALWQLGPLGWTSLIAVGGVGVVAYALPALCYELGPGVVIRHITLGLSRLTRTINAPSIPTIKP
jgi:Na+-driven multidrug efflux pump